LAKKRKYIRVKHSASLLSIANRYEAGESLSAIAADYGTNVGTVRNIARRVGCLVRPVGRPRKVECAD
jgi:hypothetical protein